MSVKVLENINDLKLVEQDTFNSSQNLYIIDVPNFSLEDLSFPSLHLRIAKEIVFSSDVILIFENSTKILKNTSLSKILQFIENEDKRYFENSLSNILIVIKDNDKKSLPLLIQQLTYLRLYPKVYTEEEYKRIKELSKWRELKNRIESTILSLRKFISLEKNYFLNDFVQELIQELSYILWNPLEGLSVSLATFSSFNSGKTFLLNCIAGYELDKISMGHDTKNFLMYIPSRKNREIFPVDNSPSMQVQKRTYIPLEDLQVVLFDTVSYDISEDSKKAVEDFVNKWAEKIDIFVFISDYTKHAQNSEMELFRILADINKRYPDKSFVCILNKLDQMMMDHITVKNIVRANEFVKSRFLKLYKDDSFNVVFIPVILQYFWALRKVEVEYSVKTIEDIENLIENAEADLNLEIMLKDLKRYFKLKEVRMEDLEVFHNFSSFLNLIKNESEKILLLKIHQYGETNVINSCLKRFGVIREQIENFISDFQKPFNSIIIAFNNFYTFINEAKNSHEVNFSKIEEYFRNETNVILNSVSNSLYELDRKIAEFREKTIDEISSMKDKCSSEFLTKSWSIRMLNRKISTIQKQIVSDLREILVFDFSIDNLENSIRKSLENFESRLSKQVNSIEEFQIGLSTQLSEKVREILKVDHPVEFLDEGSIEKVNRSINALEKVKPDIPVKIPYNPNFRDIVNLLDKLQKIIENWSIKTNTEKPSLFKSLIDILTFRYFRKLEEYKKQILKDFELEMDVLKEDILDLTEKVSNVTKAQIDEIKASLELFSLSCLQEFRNYEQLREKILSDIETASKDIESLIQKKMESLNELKKITSLVLVE